VLAPAEIKSTRSLLLVARIIPMSIYRRLLAVISVPEVVGSDWEPRAEGTRRVCRGYNSHRETLNWVAYGFVFGFW
jgi:hypothetical protein